MISLKINQLSFFTKNDISILEACKIVGIKIPRFCYHEILSIAGNCRLCLVKMDEEDKLLISCLTLVAPNMNVITEDPTIIKAREEILEFLLIDHPLDCPICDQGGECDLQNQSKSFSSPRTKYYFNKMIVEDKNFSVFIKSIMTRCIHCTRCVRFANEVAGLEFFGTIHRGNRLEINTYREHLFTSEISSNVIDLCPVGSLTYKLFNFEITVVDPWSKELLEVAYPHHPFLYKYPSYPFLPGAKLVDGTTVVCAIPADCKLRFRRLELVDEDIYHRTMCMMRKSDLAYVQKMFEPWLNIPIECRIVGPTFPRYESDRTFPHYNSGICLTFLNIDGITLHRYGETYDDTGIRLRLLIKFVLPTKLKLPYYPNYYAKKKDPSLENVTNKHEIFFIKKLFVEDFIEQKVTFEPVEPLELTDLEYFVNSLPPRPTLTDDEDPNFEKEHITPTSDLRDRKWMYDILDELREHPYWTHIYTAQEQSKPLWVKELLEKLKTHPQFRDRTLYKEQHIRPIDFQKIRREDCDAVYYDWYPEDKPKKTKPWSWLLAKGEPLGRKKNS